MRHGMVLGVGMVAVTIMVGCGADHSDQIVDLQKQIALLSRQVEETHKDLHVLQETDKNLKQSLDATDAELSRLAALESLPSTMAKEKRRKLCFRPLPMVYLLRMYCRPEGKKQNPSWSQSKLLWCPVRRYGDFLVRGKR